MNERIRQLAKKAGIINRKFMFGEYYEDDLTDEQKKFAELIVAECMEQVEQAKNSPFVSLDDAKRMSHFVDVTTKKITKHFGVK